MDSTSQNTVFELNLATFIRQMAQNGDISQAVPPSVTITDEVLVNPRQFEDKGEAGDDSLAVSNFEEVGEERARAPSSASSAREFNTEIFIESVRELPCLWNTSLTSYKDRTIKLNAWKQLSSLFNRDAEFLKAQLKNLKDAYKKCLDRINKATRSGSSPCKVTKCKYFEQLSFLFDKTANKPTESNLNIDKVSLEGFAMGEFSQGSAKRKLPLLENAKSFKSPKTKAELGLEVDKMLIKTLQGFQTETEQSTEESIPVQKQDESADSLFCHSLIPILENLSAKKNRYAKMKIQELLYEIEFDDSV